MMEILLQARNTFLNSRVNNDKIKIWKENIHKDNIYWSEKQNQVS